MHRNASNATITTHVDSLACPQVPFPSLVGSVTIGLMGEITTRTESDAMAAARAALLALNKSPEETGARAAEALFELNAVHPPYPPARTLPAEIMPTVAEVNELLLHATQVAADAQEVDRIIRAATALSTPYAG